jgi:hypothetical protein
MFISDAEAKARLHAADNLARRNEIAEKPRRTLTNYNERKEIRYQTPEDTQQDNADDTPAPESAAPRDGTTIAPLHNGGRRPGDINLSREVRSIIGTIANMDTLKNTAKAFGVSPHHAHELKHGKHSNAQGTNPELASSIDSKLESARNTAAEMLTNVLLGMDTSRIRKPRDAVYVADKLSTIATRTVRSSASGEEEGNGGATKLIVYAPTIKQENHYESVHTGPSQQDR